MMRHVVRLLVLCVVGATLTVSAPQVAHAAAPPAPGVVSPDVDDNFVGNPVLQWSARPEAATYEVQVSRDPAFPTPVAWSIRTANTYGTPTADLPLGTYYWRVRGLDSAGVAGAFSESRFIKVSRSAPVTSTPPNGARVTYPADALVFSWAATPNAKSYEIQIDDDELFVGAPAPTTTTNTTYVPLTPPVFGTTFYWRVRAKSNGNVYSEWSPAQSYSMAWAPQTKVILRSPPSTNAATIEQVVLSWDALTGAAFYQVQVSPDANFNNPIVKGSDVSQGRKVVGTRFTDNDSGGTDLLALPAGAYYWRVRAMSTSEVAEPSAWSDTWTFTKAWPGGDPSLRPFGYAGASAPDQQTQPISPANGAADLTQPSLSWTAQRGAGAYEVQFSKDSTFSPENIASCITNHTQLTPFAVIQNGVPDCEPNKILRPGVPVYWRVRALDKPGTVLGQWSSSRSFMYDPAEFVTQSPGNGAIVTDPVLTWNPSPNVSEYKVTLTGVGTGCNSFSAVVYGTVWTPEKLNPACTGSWSWVVHGVQDDYPTRMPPHRSFSWAPATGTATTLGALSITPASTSYSAPLISWQPLANAQPLSKPHKYRIFLSKQGFNSFVQVGETTSTVFSYPGTTAGVGALLDRGGYEVFVRAVSSIGAALGDSPPATFTIGELTPPTLNTPAHCPLGSCTRVEYTTPTFSWSSVPGAGLYIVYLATDPNFTNVTREYRTTHTRLTPAESLPDSQAGEATYWYVRPCVTLSACAVFDSGVHPRAHAFRKVSVPVEAISPTPGQIVRDGHVTFSWKDYLLANKAAGVTQEASFYRVEVSNTANFTSILDTSPRVDATEYTAVLQTYPDGPLYWRVRAFDNTGNPLTYSAPVAFTKSLSGPTGLSPNSCPVVGCAPSGPVVPTLTWNAMTYSAQYEVEIYRSVNRTSAISPTNRVWSATTRMRNAVPLVTLPAGEYGWRVRRIDANGNPGQWSSDASADSGVDASLAHFAIGAPRPALNSPSPGSTVTANALLLSWRSMPGATAYRVEASTNPAFGPVLESARTDMTAWAPSLRQPTWPGGTIHWRVHALDSAGNPLATSEVWTLVRDAVLPGPNTAFVKAAYQDFLGRLPSAAELTTATANLDNATWSKDAFLQRLATSPEWVRVIVTRMYRDTLGRDPDPAGLATWVEWIRTGRFTVAQAAALFYSSQEFYQGLGGGTDPAWVTQLYQKLLGRNPDAAGLSGWVGFTRTHGRAWVAGQFYQSLESRLTRVKNLYQVLLARNPDPTGWPFWANVILTSGDIQLAVSLAASAEYHNRAERRF